MTPLACCVAVSERYGLDLCMMWPKSVNTQRFETFVRQLRGKYPWRRMCCYMDNLSVHRAQSVQKLLKDQRFKVIFNPPYSPWANCIEECFSVVKREYRKAKLRRITKGTEETDEDLVFKAFEKVDCKLV